MDDEQQPQQQDGVYPRLNGAMVGSGLYTSQIVSLVGKFQMNGQTFLCCDDGVLQLALDFVDESALDIINKCNTENNNMVEIVGQVSSPSVVAVFVVRELSKDMDMDVYNRMLAVQHNPKYAHYFKAPNTPVMMATN